MKFLSKKQTLKLALIIFSLLNIAQSATIKGVISKAENGKPLPGTNIVIPELNLGSTSRDDGSFIIKNIPRGIILFR